MKINREELKRDLAEFKLLRSDDAGELHGENKTVYEAAAILLQITDPEYVPTDDMTGAGYYAHHNEDKDMDGVFRAMIAELVEG